MKRLLMLAVAIAGSASSQTWSVSSVAPGGYPVSWTKPIYDAISGQVFFFINDNTSIYANSVYFVDNVANTSVKVGSSGSVSQTCPANTSSWPGDRHPYAQMAVDTHLGAIWLVGGVCSGTDTPSMYYMTLNSDPTLNTWHQVTPTIPSYIRDGAMVYDETHDVLILYYYDGGANQVVKHYCPTIANPTPGTLTATQTAVCSSADTLISVSTAFSTSRGSTNPGLVWDPVAGRAILYGGFTPGGTFIPNTWSWNPVAKTWTQKASGAGVGPQQNTTTQQGSPPIAWDSNAQIIRVHDPVAPAEWTYDSSSDTWTNLGNKGGDQVISAMAYDARKNALITWHTTGSTPIIQVGQFATAPTITTSSLPNGALGAAYSQTISTTQSPTCSVTSGTAPLGLTFSGCAFSGTPTRAGSYTFTVTATNGTSPDATQSYTVLIGGLFPMPTPSFTVR